MIGRCERITNKQTRDCGVKESLDSSILENSTRIVHRPRPILVARRKNKGLYGTRVAVSCLRLTVYSYAAPFPFLFHGRNHIIQAPILLSSPFLSPLQLVSPSIASVLALVPVSVLRRTSLY
ncbi:hypothetical protein HOY82DRAFT_32682 [Tuber indicum]|nr:hypothetical protein HOY82DRAFT_32682 [Tuber indicum]